MKTIRALAILALLAGVAGAALLYSGVYDTRALRPHLRATYWLLDTGLRESVERGARGIVVPPLGDEAQLGRGLALFRRHCVHCHGAPGVAPQAFALGLSPLPSNLAFTAREWPPAQLYWVIHGGIKMAGMPAFAFRMDEADLWAVVAFVERLPELTPRDYRDRVDRAADETVPPPPIAGAAPPAPDVDRGKQAIEQYACTACHIVPGIVGQNAQVGPPLEGLASRRLLAGRLPNTPENLRRWLREPQAIKPGSAMPDLGVGERDARDIAAYLATLD